VAHVRKKIAKLSQSITFHMFMKYSIGPLPTISIPSSSTKTEHMLTA
jgi:hypothetical protein|tara:strand:- start:489 stop:629 length:141 start_codon:yes stop_codon:yes gene_type:complete